MKNFFNNLFTPKNGQKQHNQNDQEEKQSIQHQNEKPQKQKTVQKVQFETPQGKNSQKNKGDMDNLSKKYQQRTFKVNEQANTSLQQSVQLKKIMTANDVNQSNGSLNQEVYEALLNSSINNYSQQQKNSNQSQLEEYIYQIAQNGSFQGDYVNEYSFNNDTQNIKLNQKQIESKQDKKNIKNLNKNKQVDFANEKQKMNMQTSAKIFTKQETNLSTQSNAFINESEVFQSKYNKQDTQHFKKQETIQNHYLESIFISEDEYSSDEENEYSMEVVDEQQEVDEMSNTSSQSKQNQNSKQQKSNKEKMELRNIYTFYNKDVIESRILEAEEEMQKTKQIIHLKRKRKYLCTIPDENGKSSFEITCQRGKKKVVNTGLSISIQHIPSIHTNFKVSNTYMLNSNSKSNLNSLIIKNQQNNLDSLFKYCSDIYSFCEITTLVSQFQYIKQETLIHHQINDFRFIEKIGQGSYGKVYLYEFIPLKIPVAVKNIEKEQLEIFARELYLMESLQSTYMPQLFYYDETEMQLFMELGLCSLEDLRLYCQSSGEYISDDQAFAILSQIVLAVEIFIDQKAFHSDIKPQNIVIRSKLDENKQICLELMIIDYGGSSFDVEDYLNFHTPAFVCTPLLEKIQNGYITKELNKKYFEKGLTFMECDEGDQDDECEEKNSSDTISSMKLSKANNKKEENQFINQIYSQTSLKSTNLQSLDKQVSQLIQNNEQQLKTNQVLESRSTNPTTTKDNLIIQQLDQININQNANILSQSFSTQNTPKVQQQNSQLTNNNTKGNSIANNQTGTIQNQLYKSQKSNNKLDNNKGNQVQFADEYTSNKQKKLENLNMITKQLESMQQYQKTYNFNYDKNSERNPVDLCLNWEEIRYSEVYAACRCVQYLILQKEDSSELFLKKNIQQFILKYHKLYPKTLKLMYKIYSKQNTYSLSKSQLNQLFSKTKVKDYKINIDPNLLFNISPIKKIMEKRQAQSN